MRQALATISYVLSATSHWWWEFVRTFVFYEPASHMLREQFTGMSIDTLVQVGAAVFFAGIGTVLIWPSRPNFMRWGQSVFDVFLERDSRSDQYGIQTFPTITYIQISIRCSRAVTGCRAWITKVEYSPDGTAFSLEHNERLPCQWSKHPDYSIDLIPHEPPIRCTVAVCNDQTLSLTPEIPTNLQQLLPRIGFHRFQITIAGLLAEKSVAAVNYVTVDWRGSGVVFVSLEPA